MKKLGLTIGLLLLLCLCSQAQLKQTIVTTNKGAHFYIEASSTLNTISGNHPEKAIFFENFDPLIVRIKLQLGYIGYHFCSKVEFSSKKNQHINMGLGFLNTGFTRNVEENSFTGTLNLKTITQYNFLLYQLGSNIVTSHFSFTPEIGLGFSTKSTETTIINIEDLSNSNKNTLDLASKPFGAFLFLTFSKNYKINNTNLVIGLKVHSSLNKFDRLDARLMGLGLLMGLKI